MQAKRRQCKPIGNNASWCKSREDDARWWFAIVWLGSLESQFVIKEAVVCLNWGLSSMIVELLTNLFSKGNSFQLSV